MKLYNLNTDKIENIKTFVFEGIRYILDKLSETQLNSIGLYRIAFESPYARRYYISTQIKALIGNIYTISYIKVDKPLIDVKKLMAKDLRETYKSFKDRPRVDTGLGFDVYGGLNDIEEIKTWYDDGETVIEDADDNLVTVAPSDYLTIRTAILADRKALFIKRKTKIQELIDLIDVEACVYYEATPYIVNEEILDEGGNGTGEFHDVTYYKNNVTDWD